MLATVTIVCNKVMNPVQFNPLYISLFSSFSLLILMIVTDNLPMGSVHNLGSLQSVKILGHKLPSVIVIGVKKCGTGAVMQQLGIHPQVESSHHYIIIIIISGHSDHHRWCVRGTAWRRTDTGDSRCLWRWGFSILL